MRTEAKRAANGERMKRADEHPGVERRTPVAGILSRGRDRARAIDRPGEAADDRIAGETGIEREAIHREAGADRQPLALRRFVGDRGAVVADANRSAAADRILAILVRDDAVTDRAHE